MAGYILGVPGKAPALPVDGAFPHLSMSWVGADGVEWDLSDSSSGVFLAADDLLGLAEAPVQRFASSSPATSGTRNRGQRTLERPVRWSVWVYAEPGAWLDLARAFLSSFDEDVPGIWRVSFPSGEVRSLVCRPTPTGSHTYTRDPVAAGWALYVVEMVAEDPFWTGEALVEAWQASDPVNFYSQTAAPLFYLSEASLLAGATMTNPGDVAAWPVWSVTGLSDSEPVTGFSAAVGSSVVSVDVNLGDGDVLWIDTHPTRQRVILNGTRARGLLLSHEFAPIPPGDSVALTLALEGQGVVEAAIVPQFKRCV